MRYVCPEGCVVDVGMSKPHPGECPEDGHGRYRYEKALGSNGRKPLRPVSEKREREEASSGKPRHRSTLKRGKGFEASPAQRAKVKLLPCLGCGKEGEGVRIDPAHLWARGRGGCDHPDCVIPLCRACHDKLDDPSVEFDLLSRMVGSEAWQVELAHPILCHGVGLLELARRLTGETFEGSPALLREIDALKARNLELEAAVAA